MAGWERRAGTTCMLGLRSRGPRKHVSFTLMHRFVEGGVACCVP